MIGLLSGQVIEINNERIILLVAGVGYDISVSDFTRQQLKINQETKVFIKEQIKEDSYDLYGFLSHDDRELFTKLLSVKNVGPKVALAVLNLGSTSNVKLLIANGDTKTLQTAKGVGRRAAEQIVVELRDKLGLVASQIAEDIVNRSGEQFSDEAETALVSLGYSLSDAKVALMHIDKNLSTEDRIKLALKKGV